MSTPLEGIRVLDFTQLQHGAYSTTMLADLGAEVIKVEPPKTGERARGGHTGSPDQFDAYFQAHNRGKKGITIDLKHPKGLQIVYRLVPRVDVLTENFSVGVMDRLGLGYDDLQPLNPGLIYGSNTAYGSKGPMREWRGMDSMFQAMGGAMVIQGGKDSTTPEVVQVPLGDQVGAILFSYAILAALFVRSRTGLGQKVEASGLGSQITLQAWRITAALRHGYYWPIPHGRMHTDPLWHYYKDSEGKWLVISPMGLPWNRICQAVGREDLKNHPVWQSARERRGSKELEELLSQIFASRPRQEWLERLQAHGICCSSVNSYDDLAEDPQVLANDYIVTIEDPHVGTMKVPGVTAKFSDTPARPTRGAPLLGEHTQEILTELGGYSPEEVAQLREEGAT